MTVILPLNVQPFSVESPRLGPKLRKCIDYSFFFLLLESKKKKCIRTEHAIGPDDATSLSNI